VIRPIQYLRGIAALSVVWLHALTMMDGFTDVFGPPRFGSSGVHIFFVISGFIMVITTMGKPTTAGEFLHLRIVRVVPLYWLATLLMVGCAILGAFKKLQFSPVTVAKSLLFIPYGHEPVLVPGWTLNYEMFFYALFALSLTLPKRARLPSLIAGMLGLVVAGHVLHPANPIAQTYTSSILLEFLAGSVIAYLWINQKLNVSLPISVGAIAIGTAVLFGWNESMLFGCSELVGSALVVAGCLQPSIRGIKNALLLVLGDASYSIYLTHPFTLAALRVVWLRLVPHVSLASVISFMALALIASAVGGFAVFRVVEKPLTSMLRGKLGRRAGPLIPNSPETRMAPTSVDGGQATLDLRE
jgi:exopolysaccharide production protein ExoZ